MSAPLRLGISTCPNDTYAFAALLEGRVEAPEPLAIELHDVQELNRRLAASALELGKASAFAALRLARTHALLDVGAALGRGVGPVVVAGARRRPGTPRVLCPGEHTTAHLLWRLLHPGAGEVRHTVFSEILPALQRGEADLGVCIHEGRFTYGSYGLELVEDLGESWERATGLMLPLGGILGRRELGEGRLLGVARAVRESLDRADGHPPSALAAMRAHAREQDDAVLWAHVELYVTDETRRLSADGRAALTELGRRAAAAGLLSADTPALRVAGDEP